MFWMPFMFWNMYFLCSGCHLCFNINIFYVLDVIYALKYTFYMFWKQFMVLKITFNVPDCIFALRWIFSMFWMPFMVLNMHLLCSGRHAFLKINTSYVPDAIYMVRIIIFYVLDAIFAFIINIVYAPARAARVAGTARNTPTLQNDRNSNLKYKKVYSYTLLCGGVLFF